ncbi:hypothetical protein HBI26_182030 [Parastagonospora nodorum]|nr:hypothetical protein HBI26_182030 [Parastagonospora nodorum]
MIDPLLVALHRTDCGSYLLLSLSSPSQTYFSATMTDSSCSECIKGTIHSGQPKGTEELIHGLNTYVIGNRINPRGIIVIYSDIFGLALPNNKLIADAYAASGQWLVYLPDFFHGDPVDLKVADALLPVDAAAQSTFAKYTGILASMPTFLMWRTRHKHADVEKTCIDFLSSLRHATPDKKIGIVGFCWGGRYAIRAGMAQHQISINNTATPLIDAVVALHPSNMVLPDDVMELVVPVSYGWGAQDIAVSYATRGKIEKFHEEERGRGKRVPEMKHCRYEPGRHGFAVRGIRVMRGRGGVWRRRRGRPWSGWRSGFRWDWVEIVSAEFIFAHCV